MLSETPYIITINIDDTIFNSFKCKIFERRNSEWAYFIMVNNFLYIQVLHYFYKM